MSYRCPNCSRTDFFTAHGFSKHKAKCARKTGGGRSARPYKDSDFVAPELRRPAQGSRAKSTDGGNHGLRKRAVSMYLFTRPGARILSVKKVGTDWCVEAEYKAGARWGGGLRREVERIPEKAIVHSFKHGMQDAWDLAGAIQESD